MQGLISLHRDFLITAFLTDFFSFFAFFPHFASKPLPAGELNSPASPEAYKRRSPQENAVLHSVDKVTQIVIPGMHACNLRDASRIFGSRLYTVFPKRSLFFPFVPALFMTDAFVFSPYFFGSRAKIILCGLLNGRPLHIVTFRHFRHIRHSLHGITSDGRSSRRIPACTALQFPLDIHQSAPGLSFSGSILPPTHSAKIPPLYLPDADRS